MRKFSVPGKNALSSPPHPIKKDPPSKQINTTGELRITNYELRAGNRFWGITNYELRAGNRFWAASPDLIAQRLDLMICSNAFKER
ncbi:hypothetical protein [Planktothrix agardhii]|uniref:hypothetical protein n=1 Tax=Planktothrix agardhii TaxID=1160 RepID=UPI001F263DFC|nr:hypothetical protein [Planktothrix agardhii]MCF3576471.1 hypothetical protein [Planktothrix agardhii 1812]